MTRKTRLALLVTLSVSAASLMGATPSHATSSPGGFRPGANWGVPGGGPGELAHPNGIAVSPYGDRVYVANTLNNRIEVFDSDGVFRNWWPVPHPVSIATNTAGHVYMIVKQFGQTEIVRTNERGAGE